VPNKLDIHTQLWQESVKDLGVDRRIILKWFLKEIMCENMDWVLLAQDGDKWRAVVNMVVNFEVP